MALLESFGLQDAIDVLIIAVLLYQAYALLVGTRAWNVLRGLLAADGARRYLLFLDQAEPELANDGERVVQIVAPVRGRA